MMEKQTAVQTQDGHHSAEERRGPDTCYSVGGSRKCDAEREARPQRPRTV